MASSRTTSSVRSVGCFDARLGHAIHSRAFCCMWSRSTGIRRSSSRRSVWKLRITSARPCARRIDVDALELEARGRVEQQHAALRLDPELARQRGSGVAGAQASATSAITFETCAPCQASGEAPSSSETSFAPGIASA